MAKPKYLTLIAKYIYQGATYTQQLEENTLRVKIMIEPKFSSPLRLALSRNKNRLKHIGGPILNLKIGIYKNLDC